MAQALATFAHPSHSLAVFLQFELFRVYNNNKAATAAAYFYSEVSMKRIALFFCFIFSFAAHANNIIVNGTRFIYPEMKKK